MLLKHRLNAVLIAQGCIKTFVLTQPQMFLIYVPFADRQFLIVVLIIPYWKFRNAECCATVRD